MYENLTKRSVSNVNNTVTAILTEITVLLFSCMLDSQSLLNFGNQIFTSSQRPDTVVRTHAMICILDIHRATQRLVRIVCRHSCNSNPVDLTKYIYKNSVGEDTKLLPAQVNLAVSLIR